MNAINQRNTTFDSRYKFTAKELDNETNYTYFGARYYDSDLSIWLSVDPWSDNYPSMSPFMYCGGNPVIIIDPNGKGGKVTKNFNSYARVTGVTVSATVYIYGTQATPELATQLQDQINSQWNSVGKVMHGNDSYNVKFDIKVQAIGIEEAEKLAANNKDLSVNFMRVFDETESFATSKFSGNSGMLNLDQNTRRNGTTVAHEAGHMFGFKSNDPDDNTHLYKRINGILPIMYNGKGADQYGTRQVTLSDIKGLNLFNDFIYSREISKYIGNKNTDIIYKTNDSLKD